MKPLNLIFLLVLFIIGIYCFQIYHSHALRSTLWQIPVHTTPTQTIQKDESFGIYHVPKIPNKSSYRIALVGDSMTQALGIFGGKLSEYLNTLYKSTPGHQRIIVDNYAIGSTNILDLHKQMTTKLTSANVTLVPLVSAQPDLILIESFGYNPLSQLGLVNGQQTQTKTLDETMKFLSSTLKHTAIIFVATIAPNKETYALEEDPGIPVKDRTKQAEERMAYIKNHILYASVHKIPLIDIFDQSISANGDGNIIYINPTDHIHPSFAGIDFIDHQIANYVYASQILPQ